MLIVLSPAKRLSMDGHDAVPATSQPRFMEEAEELINVLRNYDPSELASLMNVSNEIAELNHERFARWSKDLDEADTAPALLAFQGDVYRELAANKMGREDLAFAQDHLRILSGLYGVLRPLDLMQPYRLEMSTKLENPTGKDLYAFWGNKITDALAADMKEQGEEVLLDLASKEYFKAVQPDRLGGKLIRPVFKENKGGKYKVVAINAKRARGMMTRYVIEERITRPADLKGFDRGGYLYNDELSDEVEWVFTKG